MENHHAINGKIHYFNGHFPSVKMNLIQATRRFDQKARFRLREHKLSTSRDGWENWEKAGKRIPLASG
jgi:hypothetical protein